MTYRTVRIVAELRLRKSTACFARCSAVSTVVKTTPSCFNLGCRLFALWSLCDLDPITSKVVEGKSLRSKKIKPTEKLVFFWCRKRDSILARTSHCGSVTLRGK